MTTQIDYEAIARENGYTVLKYNCQELYYWTTSTNTSMSNYNSPNEAYRACCTDNNLIKGE